MDARERITKWRTDRKLTTDEVARQLSISARLLEEIEAGGFTHPKIAVRMQAFFGLADDETSQLVSPNHIDDVIEHQNRLRSDDFTKKKYSECEIEYYSYKNKRFGKDRPGRRKI